MAKIHIDENVSIRTNNDAELALKKQNDAGFLSKDGVIKVTEERWNLAQSAESKHWMHFGLESNDDRNYDHARNFNNYKSLKGRKFLKAVEFGCGPFTNLRVISNFVNIEKCILVDPLINTYLNHSNCRYKDKHFLKTDNSKEIEISSFIDFPGEKIVESLNCDLVVCINVLEHCYDAELFFNNLYNSCVKNGFVVFHDKFYTYDKAKQSVENVYDAAHPLRIGQNITENFLGKFKQVYRLDVPLENHLTDMVQDMVYFIGQK